MLTLIQFTSIIQISPIWLTFTHCMCVCFKGPTASTCACSCVHHCSEDTEHSIVLPFYNLITSHIPSQAPIDLPFILNILSFQKCYINNIVCNLCTGFISLSVISWRFTQVCACWHSFPLLSSIPGYGVQMHHSLFSHSPVEGHLMFPVLDYYE